MADSPPSCYKIAYSLSEDGTVRLKRKRPELELSEDADVTVRPKKRKRKRKRKRKEATPPTAQDPMSELDPTELESEDTAVTVRPKKRKRKEATPPTAQDPMSELDPTELESEDADDTVRPKKKKRKRKRKAAPPVVYVLPTPAQPQPPPSASPPAQPQPPPSASPPAQPQPPPSASPPAQPQPPPPAPDPIVPNLSEFLATFDVNSFAMNPDAKFEVDTHWPWTARAHKRELDYGAQENQLKLHGLYKNRGRRGGKYTEQDVLDVQNTVQNMGENGEACMHTYWPSLIRTFSNFQLWANEHVKHGLPSGMVQEEYFKLALFYYHSLTNNLKFRTNREYTVSDFLQKLNRHANKHLNCNHTPNLACFEARDIRCMRQFAPNSTCLIFKGVSMCMERTQNGMQYISSAKNQTRWGSAFERSKIMKIPHGPVGQEEGSETETDN